MSSAERGVELEAKHLTPRLGIPEDVAALVAFLARDEASFITGIDILLDGGVLSHMPTWDAG